MNETELVLVIAVTLYSTVKKKKRQRLLKDRLHVRGATELYIATVHFLHLSVRRVVVEGV